MLTEAEFAEAVEAVRNDHEPSIPDLIAHDRAQRAEIERLRGDVRVARNELALERESYEQMHDVAIRHRQDSDKWAALAADATARAEKAEADLARYPTSAADAVICKQQMIEQRARADRYLAAIKEYVQATAAKERAEEAYTFFGLRMMDRSLPPVTEADVNAAFTTVATARDRAYASTVAISAIVEEARRG